MSKKNPSPPPPLPRSSQFHPMNSLVGPECLVSLCVIVGRSSVSRNVFIISLGDGEEG